MTSVALVDDHLLLAQLIAHELTQIGIDATIIDIDQPIVEQVAALRPHTVLLDLQLGAGRPDGTELIDAFHGLGARVLMLTGVDNDVDLARCLAAGADGVVQKAESITRVVEQVRFAIEGSTELLPGRNDRVGYQRLLTEHETTRAVNADRFSSLTNREAAALAGLTLGKSAAAMAEEAFVGVETVRSQIKAVLRKLEVHTQLEAVAMAREAGWSPDNQDADRQKDQNG